MAAGEVSPSSRQLVDLAAALLGTRYAQLSLLTDQQVIAAASGRVVGPDVRTTSLDDSLCARTVVAGRLVTIDDTGGRPDLAALPVVVDGLAGSYLGTPLADLDGRMVGALCAYDPIPRQWSERDTAILRTLGAELQRELFRPPADTAGQASTLRTELALEAAQLGSFELDLTTGQIVTDERFAAFFGRTAEEACGDVQRLRDQIHRSDQARIERELTAAVEERREYVVEYRIVRPDGAVRWLSVRGRVLVDLLGRPSTLTGIAYDATVQHGSRDQLARMLETMTDAFFRLGPDWRFRYVNAEAERILGRSQDELLGQPVWDAFPEASGSQFQVQYERAVGSGVPVSFEDYFAPLDMWYEVRATPDADGLSVFFHDVSDRKRAEQQREQAAARLTLLAEATSLMAATLDADAGLDRLAELLVPSFADWSVISLLQDDGELRPVAVRHAGGRHDVLAVLVRRSSSPLPPESPTAQVLAGGRPMLLPYVTDAMVAATDPDGEAGDLLAELYRSSLMMVPLVARGRVLGTIGLVAAPPRWFTADDLEVAADLGRRAGLSVDNARLYAQARTAQAAAESSSSRLSLVAEVARSLISTLDTDESMRRLLALVVSRLADWGVVMLRDDDGRLVDAVGRHRDSALTQVAERLAAAHIGRPHETSWVGQVARTGEPLLVAEPDLGAGARPNDRPDLAALLERAGLGSVLVVPLLARDRTLGVLVLGRTPDAPAFGDDDLATATDIGRRAGLSLENAQLFSRQRRAAEVLQRSLLTRLPEPDHLEVVARYLPAAQEAQVGGDWYDAFLQPDGATVLAIGDVVGHDMGAAAAMGQLRNLLRGTAYDREDTPAHVLSRVDAAIRGLQVDTLATAVIGRIEQDDEDRRLGRRRVRWSNAGHPPPMLLAADGRVTELDGTPDLLLGLDPRTERRDHETVLEDDATLLFYTDGLVERRDSPLDAGLARLRQALAALAGEPLETLCDELLARLLPGEADDDVALVAVRLHPEDRPRPTDIAAPHVPELVRAAIEPSEPTGPSRQRAHLHLRGEASDVSRARQFLRTSTAPWRLPTATLEAAVLVLSEVVTNAIRYAPGPVYVTVAHLPGLLRIEVEDSAHDLGSAGSSGDPVPADAEGGRGLFLVDALSERWGVRTIPDDGKVVWIELPT